jgi:hypothetical protein
MSIGTVWNHRLSNFDIARLVLRHWYFLPQMRMCRGIGFSRGILLLLAHYEECSSLDVVFAPPQEQIGLSVLYGIRNNAHLPDAET